MVVGECREDMPTAEINFISPHLTSLPMKFWGMSASQLIVNVEISLNYDTEKTGNIALN